MEQTLGNEGLIRGRSSSFSVCVSWGCRDKSHRLGGFNSGHLLFLSLEAGVQDQGVSRVCSFQGL